MTKPQATSTRRGRLGSIDVLRGAAALGVVLCHTTRGALFLDSFRIAPWVTVLALPAAFGFSGVYLFFVISGFCIHLAWARERATNGKPDIAFVPFWKRRVRRLYPPYLVALGLYLLVIWVEGTDVFSTRSAVWDIGLHLVMLHNIDPATAWSINGVFWTLAIEEQLYLAYFLLLLIRCRFGWATTLTICALARVFWFALAFVAHRAFAVQIPVTEAAASHWFTWALGAWSVEAWYGLVPRPRWTINLVVCGSLITAAMMLSASTWAFPRDGLVAEIAWFIADPLWGLGFFVLVSRLSLAEAGSHGSAGHSRSRLWQALRAVGIFSYSLYLTHELVLTHGVRILGHALSWSKTASVTWQVFALAPASVVLAWGFYRVFERPFVTKAAPL